MCECMLVFLIIQKIAHFAAVFSYASDELLTRKRYKASVIVYVRVFVIQVYDECGYAHFVSILIEQFTNHTSGVPQLPRKESVMVGLLYMISTCLCIHYSWNA